MFFDKTSTADNGFQFLPLSYKVGVFLFPIGGGLVKDFGSTVFVILGLISLFYLRGVNRRLSAPEKYLFSGFIAYFLFSMVTIVYAEELKPALSQVDRNLRFLAFVPMYLVVRNHDLRLKKAFLYGLVVAGLAGAIYTSYLAYGLGMTRAYGHYHPNVFSIYAAIIVVVLLAEIVNDRKGARINWLYSLGIAGGLVTSYLTQTRSSWLAILISTCVIVVYLFKTRRAVARKISLAVLVMVVVVVTAVPGVSDRIRVVFEDIQSYKQETGRINSVGDRLEMWSSAIDMARNTGLLGVGIGNYRNVFQREYKQTGKVRGEVDETSAHNIMLHSLAETGIVGMLAMIVGIFVFPIIALYLNFTKDIYWGRVEGISILTVFFVVGITENWLGRNPMINLYLVSLLVVFSAKSPGRNIEAK